MAIQHEQRYPHGSGQYFLSRSLFFLRSCAMRKRLGPLTDVDHAALVRLCKHKKFIHRTDGYGTESETLISTASANTLKKRELAVTGWNREIYPTKSGHALSLIAV